MAAVVDRGHSEVTARRSDSNRCPAMWNTSQMLSNMITRTLYTAVVLDAFIFSDTNWRAFEELHMLALCTLIEALLVDRLSLSSV